MVFRRQGDKKERLRWGVGTAVRFKSRVSTHSHLEGISLGRSNQIISIAADLEISQTHRTHFGEPHTSGLLLLLLLLVPTKSFGAQLYTFPLWCKLSCVHPFLVSNHTLYLSPAILFVANKYSACCVHENSLCPSAAAAAAPTHARYVKRGKAKSFSFFLFLVATRKCLRALPMF